MRTRARRALLRGGVALALLMTAPAVADEVEEEEPARPTIFKWVDTNGIAHYTTDPERIPESLRDGVRRLGHPSETERLPAVAAGPRRERPARSRRESDYWAVRDAGREDPWVSVGDAYAPFVEGAAGATTATTELHDLEDQIASLEGEIARDEEVLKSLISNPANADPLAIADDTEFREVARRLPKLQANLRALREERGELQP